MTQTKAAGKHKATNVYSPFSLFHTDPLFASLDNLVSSEILATQIQLLSLTELRKTQKTYNIHFS